MTDILSGIDYTRFLKLETELLKGQVDLVRQMPLFNVNWNNYKYHGNPVLTEGGAGTWDEGGLREPSIIVEHGVWKMWYAGCTPANIWALGYATSPDGLTWTKHPANPILSPMEYAWESHPTYQMTDPCVIKVRGIYHLYYQALGYWGDYPAVPRFFIGHATSTDGLTWSKSPLPALSADYPPFLFGRPAPVAFTGITSALVVYDFEHDRFVMYSGLYAAFNGDRHVIGIISESTDGVIFVPKKTTTVSFRGIARIGCLWIKGAVLERRDIGIANGVSISLDLENWVALPKPFLYQNQLEEGGTVFEIVNFLAHGDHLYQYFQYRRPNGTPSPGFVIGLTRPPLTRFNEPCILWENKSIGTAGDVTMVIEPDGKQRKTFWVRSSSNGTLYIQGFEEVTGAFFDIDSVSVAAGVMTPYITEMGLKQFRLRFVPTASATVSAWCILE